MPQRPAHPGAPSATGRARTGPELGRRSFLALLGLGALGACTTDSAPPGTAQSPGAPPGTQTVRPTSLSWANWPAYIDEDDKHPKVHPTLVGFTKRSGIRVDYRTVINDNVEFVDKVGSRLDRHEPIGYDVMALTSWMSAQLVQDEKVQALDKTLIPNASHLIRALSAPPWDPRRSYSMPWQAGLTGIAYNASLVERAVGSMKELLTRKDLAGRVGFLTEYPDTVGLAILSRGGDPTDLVTADVENALEVIGRAKTDGQVRGFYGNDFVDALQSGKLAACLAWSGDVLQAQLKTPNIKFVVPEEGLMIWSDDMLVPRGSTKAAAVAEMIDYFYEPAVAAKVAAWVNYICPVEGAQEEMGKLDPDLALSPLIFPDATILDQSRQFGSLPPDDDRRLRSAFSALAV